MAFLQKRFSYQTNLKSSLGQIKKIFGNDLIHKQKKDSQMKKEKGLLKDTFVFNISAKINFYSIKKRNQPAKFFMFNKTKIQSGFVNILLLPFITLMMTGIMGLSFLSMGIKNITRFQSYCITTNLKGQKELRETLTKLLSLNNKVLFAHKTRKALEASLVTVTALGLVNLIPPLKQKLKFVQKTQKILIIKQKYLLTQSFLIKRKTFNNFKKQLKKFNIFNIKEETFYKKALAVKEKKEGDKAYTYKPVPDFINYQKSRFSWTIQPFFPLNKSLLWLLPIKQEVVSSYSCTASLQKKGEKWINTLYH